MSYRAVHLTKEGFEKILKEYNDLTKERPIAVAHLKTARELGDLSENGYYKASRAKLSFIDSRLMHLKSLIKNSKIINVSTSHAVQLGNKVKIFDGEKNSVYKIVSKFEADPENKKISDVSPLGKALIGRKMGEKVLIVTPSGEREFTIVQIYV